MTIFGFVVSLTLSLTADVSTTIHLNTSVLSSISSWSWHGMELSLTSEPMLSVVKAYRHRFIQSNRSRCNKPPSQSSGTAFVTTCSPIDKSASCTPPVWLRHFIFPNSMNTAGISKTFSSSMNSTCRFHSATCFIAYSGGFSFSISSRNLSLLTKVISPSSV